MPFESPGVTI